MGVWWYATDYVAFLLIWKFLHKGLDCLEQHALKRLLIIMFVLWTVSTLVPFFQYGSTNFICFVMLYCYVLYVKKYNNAITENKRKNIQIVTLFYILALISIIGMDILGIHVARAAEYSCYFIRGNYRLFPVVISIGIFLLATQWKIKSKVINRISKLTFGIYLFHMYPLTMDYLFKDIFNMSKVTNQELLPVWLLIVTTIVFACGCGIEAVRRVLFKLIFDKADIRLRNQVMETIQVILKKR